MAADEQTRQRVYARLRNVLGEEVATTLMSDRPPFDWSEVPTKTDLIRFPPGWFIIAS